MEDQYMYIFSQKPGREKSIMKFRYLQEVNIEYLNPSGMCPQSLGLMNHTVLSEVQIILEIWHGGKSDGKVAKDTKLKFPIFENYAGRNLKLVVVSVIRVIQDKMSLEPIGLEQLLQYGVYIKASTYGPWHHQEESPIWGTMKKET